jgi:hypothetical protein
VVFGDVMACGSSRKLCWLHDGLNISCWDPASRTYEVRLVASPFGSASVDRRCGHGRYTRRCPAGGGPRATTGMRHPKRPGLQYKEMSLRGVQGWPDRRTP